MHDKLFVLLRSGKVVDVITLIRVNSNLGSITENILDYEVISLEQTGSDEYAIVSTISKHFKTEDLAKNYLRSDKLKSLVCTKDTHNIHVIRVGNTKFGKVSDEYKIYRESINVSPQ